MADSNFIDYVKVCCRTGNGGAGNSHFHRDKYNPRGGPDGGDGGNGGSVILKGNEQMWTLLPLKYRKHILCDNGANGAPARKTGKNGADQILEVPLGTIAKDAETGEVLVEITHHNQMEIIVSGGRGGLGNWNFKTPTNQAPEYAQPGTPGKEQWVILELKVLADVGLVGFPNAGKSTLLSAITAAKPKIADYPFTTMVPNLGMVPYREYKSFCMADIPGIIEGAADGKGLGHRFLRHIERNAALLFMVPADADDHQKQFDILAEEIKQYNPEMLFKDRLYVISKSDLLDEELKSLILGSLDIKEVHFISAATGEGLQPLKDNLWRVLNLEKKNEAFD